MRRFIVEVVLDALLLLVIILLLGIVLGRPAVPVRPDVGPIVDTPGRRRHRLPVVGRHPGPGQPLRPAGPRRADRSPAVLDDGLLRRDHQRDRDLASPRSSPRSRSPTSPTRRCSGSSSRRRCTRSLSTRAWTRSSASIGRTSAPIGAAASGASSSRCPRRAGTSIIENLRLQQVYNAIYTTSLDIALAGHAGRRDPALVRAASSSARRTTSIDATGPGADRGDAPAARPDLREDRPDDGEPERHPAARLDRRAVEAPERGRPVRLRGRRRDRHQGARRAAGGAVRDLRPDPVRGGLDGPGPPGAPA